MFNVPWLLNILDHHNQPQKFYIRLGRYRPNFVKSDAKRVMIMYMLSSHLALELLEVLTQYQFCI
jgi:hypothetical protein